MKAANNGMDYSEDQRDKLFAAVNESLKHNDHAGAIKNLKSLAIQLPGNAWVLNTLGALLFGQGNYTDCEAAFRELSALQPADAAVHNNLGNALYEQRRFEEAAGAYADAVSAQPDLVDARFNLGTAYQSLGRYDDAITSFRAALQLAPGSLESTQHLCALLIQEEQGEAAIDVLKQYETGFGRQADLAILVGAAMILVGDREGALEHYRTAIDLDGGTADLYNDYGIALASAGRHEEALPCFEEALKLKPETAAYFNNSCPSLISLDRLEEAETAVQRALEIEPDGEIYQRSMAKILVAQGHLKVALPYLKRSVEINPDYTDGYISLGSVLTELGRNDEAVEADLEAIRCNPKYPEPYRNLALTYLRLGDIKAALKIAADGLNFVTDDHMSWITMAYIQSHTGDYTGALETLKILLNRDPDNISGLELKSISLRELSESEQYLKVLLRRLELQPDSSIVISELMEAVLMLCDWDQGKKLGDSIIDVVRKRIASNEAVGVCINNLQAFEVGYEFIAKAAVSTARSLAKDQARIKSASNFQFPSPAQISRDKGKIRLGYLLPYMHFHSLPALLKPIIETHDRSRFEIIGFCKKRPIKSIMGESAFSEEYVNAFDRIEFNQGSEYSFAHNIYDQGIDILVDVAGQTLDNCMKILALRPAPVIVHYLGYSITTGAEFVDYLVTDEIYIPPEDIALGPEKGIYLPNSFMFANYEDVKQRSHTRQQERLPEKAVVFCDFNQNFKFEPEILKTWMRILKRVPNSVFWFLSWNGAAEINLKKFAANQGVDPDRLIFADIYSHEDHLARLPLADLCLDTNHHGGGATTNDCLWSGVPVLTTTGVTPAGRLGHSILSAAGLPEMIADDIEAYEEMAVEFGLNPEKLADLKRRWQPSRKSQPLFDFPKYVQNLETGYEMAWDNYRQGNAPRNLFVPE